MALSHVVLPCRPYAAHLSQGQQAWLCTQLQSHCQLLEDGEVELHSFRRTLAALQVRRCSDQMLRCTSSRWGRLSSNCCRYLSSPCNQAATCMLCAANMVCGPLFLLL